MMNLGPIVIYDGQCGFCHFWIKWLIARDQKKIFRFAASQSIVFKKFSAAAHLPTTTPSNTVLLFFEGRIYQKSAAVIKILSQLSSSWKLCALLLYCIPRPLRDWVYDGVAIRRYRWCKSPDCLVPSELNKERQLEI